MSLDSIIFGDKTFGGLLEEIYNNQKKREKQIMGLISELRPLIQDTGDATMIVPLIKEYMDLGLKNDDHLIKMSQILQRIFTATASGASDFTMTEEEKAQLLKEIEGMESNKMLPPTTEEKE